MAYSQPARAAASVTLPVAGTLSKLKPLIADGYGGKTGSDSAAGGCLAFFTHVTVGGRAVTGRRGVLGQGQGSNTSEILAGPGNAAERLVQFTASASGTSTPLGVLGSGDAPTGAVG